MRVRLSGFGSKMNAPPKEPRPAPWRSPLEIALIFAVFFLHGAWPVPDVNEAHYLSKAKHVWDSAWCASDFFLTTADAHQVFDWTFGWTTKFLTLDQTAWVGRLLTWALLAWAWRRLSWSLVPRAWLAVLSAELFVMLNENMHMAGEWVVGGIEAKGFAYVLVLLALEALVRNRWQCAWLLLGVASSFHVIVGGWSVLAAGIAWLFSGAERPSLGRMLPGLLGGAVLALPGLYFALSLTHGASPDVIKQANTIYVYYRLPHHLAADRFHEGFPSRHLMLWGLWLVLATVAPADATQRRLRWFAAGGMLFTLVGYALVVLGNWLPDTATALLRFYWFRTSDVVIPLSVPLIGLPWLLQIGATRPKVARCWFLGLTLVAAWDLAMQLPHLPYNVVNASWTTLPPRSDKSLAYDDWRAVCDWVRQNTQPDDLILAPRNEATIRWYANRGTVVSWKDVPQDAQRIVEWWNRLKDIYAADHNDPPAKWIDSLSPLGEARLNDLGAKYRAAYAIVELLPDVPPLAASPLFKNASYAVYRLPIEKR